MNALLNRFRHVKSRARWDHRRSRAHDQKFRSLCLNSWTVVAQSALACLNGRHIATRYKPSELPLSFPVWFFWTDSRAWETVCGYSGHPGTFRATTCLRSLPVPLFVGCCAKTRLVSLISEIFPWIEITLLVLNWKRQVKLVDNWSMYISRYWNSAGGLSLTVRMRHLVYFTDHVQQSTNQRVVHLKFNGRKFIYEVKKSAFGVAWNFVLISRSHLNRWRYSPESGSPLIYF